MKLDPTRMKDWEIAQQAETRMKSLRQLARELGLRYMPELKFFYDASFDYGAHINRVLKSIRTDDEKNYPTTEEQ